MRSLSFLLLPFLITVGSGCDNGKKLYGVTGNVNYKGAPLPAGVIWFDPDAGKGNNAPQGFAYIKEGKFDTKAKGKGVAGGGYIIRIEGFDGKPGNELPLGKPLFTDYIDKKDLPEKEAVLEIDVPAKK